MLQIYNTLGREKAPFKTIEAGKVGLYVCGVTVYDYCHLGHARAYVAFDVITRYLRYIGYNVKYVRNITDIDDKIIARAAQNQETCEALTARFIDAMNEDLGMLGILRPDQEPRATESLDLIIDLIQRLQREEFAYQAPNGDVYYRVSRDPHYGCLSGRQLEDLRAGERVAINEQKEDPLDFVLWKAAKKGEPSWPSPWGEGRPGWHIECSAMAMEALGENFDLHGGGPDLVFPHHENEIAQAEVVTKKRFANVWLHAGPLRVGREKMSKSLGNFFTIREVLQQHAPETVRYLLAASHYRSPINYEEAQLTAAHTALTRLYTALRGFDLSGQVVSSQFESYKTRFVAAMDDDFNTPEAFAVLFNLARDINRLRDENNLEEALALACGLRELGAVLGFLQADPETFLQGSAQAADRLSAQEVEVQIQLRNEARASKNWQRADEVRAHLESEGIVLEDGPTGTTWRRV